MSMTHLETQTKTCTPHIWAPRVTTMEDSHKYIYVSCSDSNKTFMTELYALEVLTAI